MSKGFDILKNVIKKSVELEYFRVTGESPKEVFDEDLKKYEELSERCNEIYKVLKENLSKKSIPLLEELDDKKGDMACLNQWYYFSQGVVAGLTNLKYLEETDSMILTLR